jgi:ubiquinone/menaquinone biosynthesis C-methylase UbiE
MMWFDPKHQRTLFADIRSETITVSDRSHGKDGQRHIIVSPDVIADFRDLPFPSESFPLVVFDPPHLTRGGSKSYFVAKYGRLGINWREDLQRGFSECFRVLQPFGALIFKWSEVHVPLGEILKLTPHNPLFGNRCGRKSKTHWLVFQKGESRPPSAALGF